MPNPNPLFNPVYAAGDLLEKAGYQYRRETQNGRPVLIVQDPVYRAGGDVLVLEGYNETKVYGGVGEGILACAVRFINARS